MMKRVLSACAVIAAVGFAGAAQANEKLAQASGCTTCHGIDKKILGPSYKDVAAKYRDAKGAEADLFKKVKAGSKGVWGPIPMPPNAHIKDDDVKTLIKWILSTK